MLEQLFGSKTRVKLLQLFLNNPHQPYYLRELARLLNTQLNSIRREVENLEKLEIIKSADPLTMQVEKDKEDKSEKSKKSSRKYFLTNSDFVLYPELQSLFLKAHLILEKSLVAAIERSAKVKLFILTGVFVGNDESVTDMLLVGSIKKKRLSKLIRKFERELNHAINYTSMTEQEFIYRRDITDRFLYDILEGKKIVIINKLER
jgi:hypothetical protein